MSQNVYQFIDVQRVDPAKKPIKVRKIEFVEIYEPFTKQQATAQADRYESEEAICGRRPAITNSAVPMANAARVRIHTWKGIFSCFMMSYLSKFLFVRTFRYTPQRLYFVSLRGG